ncbi:hypothetical protein [Pseudorhodoplanes sp.]|uniref:hypothetical protein n=1 Tax=Pseudorhodoplanes sp. TaxID=1934341 RepID=UPI002C87410C|nr:hypothetical protein [Pseudorhodoplanes sp.]HWV44146.1 hypothetical protein [Pseudorhodoplanes sp.]
MSGFEQMLRIVLYNALGAWLGYSVADGAMAQAAIAGVCAIITFGWWVYRNWKGKAPIPPVAPVLAFVIIAPMLLGGCTTIQDGLAKAMAFIGQVRTTLVEVREGIRVGCNAIGLAEQEAATVNATCVQKVSKLRAGVEAICKNQALLTDDVVGNYFSTVANAVKQAQVSCK